jgi:LysM repeat protein
MINYFSGGKSMKKILCVMAVVLPIFLTFGCKSTPDDKSSEHAELQRIYDGHPNIIVDKADRYTVKKGDTLVNITRKYYGNDNGYYFPLIMVGSQLRTSDPDKIIVGQELKIPSLRRNLDDPKARADLKSLLREIANVYADKARADKAHKERYQKDRKGLIDLSETL